MTSEIRTSEFDAPTFPLPQSVGSPALVFASWTGILALGCGVVAGLSPLRIPTPAKNLESTWLLEVFDPIVLQAVALLHCSAVLIRWRLHKTLSVPRTASDTIKRLGSALLPLVPLLFLLAIYYVVNDLLFKPSLDRPRPPIDMRIHAGVISRHVQEVTGGAPSGFASRGTLILLTAVLATLDVRRKESRYWRWLQSSWFVGLVQAVLLCCTATARVLTGYHYWFDVLLGFSFGVYLFWLVVFTFGHFSKRRFAAQDVQVLVQTLLSLLIGMSLIGFFYARDANAWAPSILAALIACVVVIHGQRAIETHREDV